MLNRIKLLFLILCFSFVLLLGVMGVLDNRTSLAYSLPLANPVILERLPVANTHTAVVTTAVSVQFDQAISPTSVTSRTFFVHAQHSGLVSQVIATAGNTIYLTPTESFHAGELVDVTVTTGTLNLTNESVVSPTVWQFRTAVTGSGRGLFVGSGQRLNDDSSTPDIALGDLDNDGDLDAYMSDIRDPDKVWLNNGDGTFVDNGQILNELHSHCSWVW